MTVETFITGVCNALHDEFGFPVYTERIEQDLNPPCFYVHAYSNSNTKRVMWRYRHDIGMEVVYFPAEAGPADARSAQAEMNNVSDRLMYLLEIIDCNGTSVRTLERTSTVSDGALVMTFRIENYERMERNPDVMERQNTVFKDVGWHEKETGN